VLAGHSRLIGLAGIVGSGAICINHFMVDTGAAMSVDIYIDSYGVRYPYHDIPGNHGLGYRLPCSS
jgi:hypothetical protein